MKFVTLESLCSEIIDCPHSTPKWLEEGIPVVRNFNLVNGHIDTGNLSYVDEATYLERIKRAKPEEGDIIISREAPMGVVGIVPPNFECCLGQRLVLLKVDRSKCAPQYLLYALLSDVVQTQINRIDLTGSIVSNLNIPDMKKLLIPMVNESTDKIGEYLQLIDSKIANNEAIVQRLETMVKTIYDYWFLQFEFPNEEGKTYKSSGGKMVWNEELQQEIPADWGVETLGSYAEVKKGKLITEKEANLNGKYKVVSAGLDFSYHHDQFNREKNTISISASGASAGFVKLWREKIFANDCTTVRKDNVAETIYVFNYLKTIQKYLYSQARGSAQPHVYPNDIENLKLVIPTDDIMAKYAKRVVNTNEYIANMNNQNEKLQSLRDFLLPLLMNGQMNIGENK